VRWATPISTLGGTQNVVPRAVSDDLIVVGIDDPSSDDLAGLRTVALNTADGNQRWEHAGVVPDFTAGETVIGRIPRTHTDVDTSSSPPADGTLVALDAASGQRRWDLSRRFADSVAELVAEDLVLVRAGIPDGNDPSARVDQSLIVEADTGREVVNLGEYASSCTSDARSIIACKDSDGKLISFRLDDRRLRVSRHPVEIQEGYLERIHGVWRDRILVEYRERVSSSGYTNRHLAVDRSANVLDDRLPGPIVAISDRYAIFRASEDGDISVHVVTP
jgi:outer membrane protein assembly factor BamB